MRDDIQGQLLVLHRAGPFKLRPELVEQQRVQRLEDVLLGRVVLPDLATGRKQPIKELMPPDAAGVVEIIAVHVTPDAASYAYSYHRILSDLFLVEGIS